MAITSTSNTEKNGEDKTAPAPSPTVQDGAVPQVRDVAHIFGKAVHINGITEVREQTVSRDVLGLFESCEDTAEYVAQYGNNEIPLPSESELAQRVIFDYITPTGAVPGDNPDRWGSPFVDGEAGKQIAVSWVDVEAAARMVVQEWDGNSGYDPDRLTLTDCGVAGYVLSSDECGVVISPIVGESSRPTLEIEQ